MFIEMFNKIFIKMELNTMYVIMATNLNFNNFLKQTEGENSEQKGVNSFAGINHAKLIYIIL